MTKDPELTRLMNPEFPGGMDYLHDLSAEELQAILVRLESEHDARDSLLRYGYVMYGERFAAARHHRLIAKYLERIERGDIDRLIISMPPRSGKPVAEDELILMADGSRKPLREVVVGDQVITHRKRARTVTAVHEQGTIPVVAVRTRHGRTVRAAPNHPFLTPSGFWPLASVQPGNVLALLTKAETSPSAPMGPEEARLIGYFIGDGSVTDAGTTCAATFTKADPATLDDFEACAAFMGFSANRREKGNHSLISLRDGVRPWLRSHGMAGKRSIEKRVPESVFRADEWAVANYVGAHFSCDGSINVKGKLKRTDVTVELYSSCRALLEDVQHLLLRFGIDSSIKDKPGRCNGKIFPSYRLTVCGYDSKQRFAARIPLVGPKRERLLGWALKPLTWEPEYLPDEVIESRPDGEAPCRCLTVEEDHTFVAGDFVVHNSLLTSTLFPAWYLGRHPHHEFMFATYAQDLSSGFGRQVRNYVASGGHQKIFPTCRVAKDSGTFYRFATTVGGSYYAVGVGGPLTGRGANCVRRGSQVATEIGPVPIEQIAVVAGTPICPRVLAYDIEQKRPVYRRVQASMVSACEPERQNEVHTHGGSILRLTRDHRVWSDGEYRRAETLRSGLPLLAARAGISDDSVMMVVPGAGPAERYYDLQIEREHNFFVDGILVSNCLLIDDPVKNREEASSDAIMSALHEWFTSAAYTRLMPSGKIILIQTRWSENDLIGWVLREQAEEGWAVLSLPAIAEQDEWVEDDISDPSTPDLEVRYVDRKPQWLFRKRGDALWPEQFPIQALQRIQRAIPRRDWMSLYQQRVSEEDGTLFKREWVQYVDRPPSGTGMNIYVLVDPANAKHKRSDSTAMWVVGLGQDNNYYVLDGIRDKLNLTEKADALFGLHRKWHPAKVGYEEYAIQADIQYMRDRMNRDNYRFEITPLRGLTKKEHRIEALEPAFRAKRVYFPKTLPYTQVDGKVVDLTREFLAEYIAFPAGAHDDMLDALSRIVDPHFPVTWPLTSQQRARIEAEAEEDIGGRTWMSA